MSYQIFGTQWLRYSELRTDQELILKAICRGTLCGKKSSFENCNCLSLFSLSLVM